MHRSASTAGDRHLRMAGSAPPMPKRADVINFGPYLLFPHLRRLERDGHVVELGSRAFDILCVLTEHAGEIVTNRDLMARVWGNVVVGDGSLRFHINALRKTLGRHGVSTEYVKNVARRGYVFVRAIQKTVVERPTSDDTSAEELGTLPQRLGKIVGRDAEIDEIVALLGRTRFVTIVGSGGLGKSTIAVEIAYLLREQFDLVRFVDLEQIKDASWVASAVATALDLVVSSANPVPSLIAYLREKRVLLIFDSCEHVLEPAAMLAEQIFYGSVRSAILATSQETLRADGEHAYTLGPLRSPAEDTQLRPEEAIRYPAVELFVSRARGTVTQFELIETNVATINAICRRVDGIPLAIELAAGRVSTLALPAILDLLDSQLALTWPGRRTAAERHRTLGAAIAWTVNLLNESDRALLRRLAVFSGPFTLDGARHVASGSTLPASSVAEALSNLVAKSLVNSCSIERSADASSHRLSIHFWLLGGTHAFAGQMLEDSGESAWVAERHAMYWCEILERTYAGSTESLHAAAWRSHAAYLTNLCAALNWALRHQNGTELLSRLAAAASPFLLDLSLLNECVRWASIGLEALEDRRGSYQELELHASLGLALLSGGGGLEEVRVHLTHALELADEQRDRYNQMRLLGALIRFHHRNGAFHRALRLANRVKVITQSQKDPACSSMADWLLTSCSHLVGNHEIALRIGERAWSSPSLTGLKRVRFGFDDHRVRALCGIAESFWLIGKADEARAAVPRVVQEAERFGHPIVLAVALFSLSRVWFWTGDWRMADEYSRRLVAHAEQHSMVAYESLGRLLQGQLAVERGEISTGVEALREAIESPQRTGFQGIQIIYAAPLARALAKLGRLDEALAVIESACELDEREGGSFLSPELLRIKGSLLAEHGEARQAEAEALLRRSFERAHQQGALAWKLRAAMSLAHFSRPGAPSKSAHALLKQTYSQFSQGFETRDLILARQVLEESAQEL
jgi:predicted ATPase/DNA-binding winged helix-turn-helix (wHTH) protein